MLNQLITLFIFYYLIIFSIIGYGLIFTRLVFDYKILNIGYLGLYGFFILIIYSYISHFLFSHNLIHNSLILILGISSFLLFLFKKTIKFDLITFSNFFILFLGLLIFKTHDDFPYYHFAYSFYLTQEPLIIGVGQFNHGFRTPSSIFYINSLFYLPIIKYFTFYIPTILILGFSNLILLNNIKTNLEKKKTDFFLFINLLIFIFINIFFYRIQEHGTDRSAQILISIFVIQIFYLIKEKNNNPNLLSHILAFLAIIISLKAFYILYLILVIPLIWIYYKYRKENLIFNFLKNKIFYLFSFLIFLVILNYFFNTGCLIYPVSLSCFDNFDWSIGADATMKMNEHYQLWSKAGKTPNFITENPEIYLQNMNWISNWINLYFFNKVSDFLLGIFLLCFIFYFIFYQKEQKRLQKNFFKQKIILIYLFLVLLLIEWFLNHPALRYGGYVLISLIIFIPLSYFLGKKQIDFRSKNIKTKVFTLIFLTIIIFSTRNFSRIYDEMNKYNYNPILRPFFYIDEKHFRIQKHFDHLIQNYEICQNEIKTCNLEILEKIRKTYFQRYIFIND